MPFHGMDRRPGIGNWMVVSSSDLLIGVKFVD